MVIALTPLAGLALGAGCNTEGQATTAHKVHDTSGFTAAELNAPLSPQARAKGIQVAPAPIR